MNKFPGELNTIEPVPAVKVKSSSRRILRLPAVTLNAPLMVISDPTVVLALSVRRPVEVWLVVVPAAIVKVPAAIVPDLKVAFEEVELFV